MENNLLKDKIISLKDLNELYKTSDSLQSNALKECKDSIVQKEQKINKLKKSRKRLAAGLSTGVVAAFIIGILL